MADPSKTEKATAKRRRDERKKGNIFMSSDAVSIAVLVTGVAILYATGGAIATNVYEFFVYSFSLTATVGTNNELQNLSEFFSRFLYTFAISAGPLFLICVVVAIAATFFQTRMLVTFDVIKPKFSKINPIEGFKKLFSSKAVVDALKGLLKIGILLYLIFSYLFDEMSMFDRFFFTDVRSSVDHIVSMVFGLIVQISIAYIVLAGFDVIYQKWHYENSIKMSKQEVKDEFKQLEGDPKIKSKIKQTQRRMAMSRMMQQVPKADVIIKNPTHYAVALRYKANKDNAPVILAMGMDEVAQRILRVGAENNVEIVENRPLARALYATGELFKEIPPDLYNAVAEVLVYIYKLKGKLKK